MSTPVDHRPRVARERRSRTRERILNAVIACYAETLANSSPTVDDVLAKAAIGRSTFYRYFDSLEDAAIVIAQQFFEEMYEAISSMMDGSDNPYHRVTVGFQLFLMRCVTDRPWGGFVSKNFHLVMDIFNQGVASDLAKGRDQGLFDFTELTPAIGLLCGAMTEAMYYLSHGGERPRAYVEELTVMGLRGLGVPSADAKATVRERAIFIRGLAPDRLKWWRDPWL